MRTLRLTQSLGDLPVASRVADDTREAWSCPLPNQIFEVGSQGEDEDLAARGIAIALSRLLSVWSTPVRRASQPLDSVPRRLSPHGLFCAARSAGMAACHLRREGRAAHRAQSTSSIVPIRGPGLRPAASAEGDASVRHGTSRSLPHVRRRDRDRVHFGEPPDLTIEPHYHHSQPTPRSRCPSPEHPRPNTSLHAMTRSSEYFGSTQTCYVATRSARSSWGAAYWRSR